MSPVRRRDLVLLAVLVAAATWAVVRTRYGDLPRLVWWQPLPLGVLAVAEALGARSLRSRLSALRQARRDPASVARPAALRPVEPLLVARLVVVAQASAWVGAVFTGVWAGVLLHTVPSLARLTAARGDTVTGVIGVLCAAGLAVAALWLEHVCKIPPEDDEQPPNGVRA
ncbi:DUF3180 domain-containing protein [Modestobacter sp. NPDC049651]|uniref:DUF3180 domain-containing protein n=1 Tax=unclassified Modestobacter TaxID=2643866 RepID=UPI0033D7881C